MKIMIDSQDQTNTCSYATHTSPVRSNKRRIKRRGSITVLVALLMIAFVAMVAISIDTSYLHLSRTELRAATDAAAQAASVTLARSQDLTAACEAGMKIAKMNLVGGKPLVLNESNFIFGNSSRNDTGKFVFKPNETPYNGVKVIVDLSAGGSTSGVNLFFSELHGVKVFRPKQEAISTFLERDIVIVIDRSLSMKGQPYKDLCNSLDVFVETLGETSTEEYVGLASYAGTASVDVDYTTELAKIPDAARDLKLKSATSISAGMEAGFTIMQKGRSKLFVERAMVVMTDGIHNFGQNPIINAQEIAADGVTIHSITFGAEADTARMQEIANIGRGKYLHADNSAELKEAFRDIALTLTTMITE
jgi:Ca-activated chloride channel family protein